MKHYVVFQIPMSKYISEFTRLPRGFKFSFVNNLRKRLDAYYQGDKSQYNIDLIINKWGFVKFQVECSDTDWLVEMKLAPTEREELILTDSDTTLTYGELP